MPLTRVCIKAQVASCTAADGKWWLRLEDSWESICLGPQVRQADGKSEPPLFSPGQQVDLIVQQREEEV